MRCGILGVIAGAALIASGCATTIISSSQSVRCGETPSSAIGAFLAGAAEFNLGMIKAVIPDGISPFAVFGDGDAGRGRAVVRNLVDHPEIHRGNEVDSSYRVREIADTPEKHTKNVRVERNDKVMLMRNHRDGDDIETVEQRSRRTFRVAFDLEKNCILAIRPVEPEWIRIQ